jgi:hypothetical protein
MACLYTMQWLFVHHALAVLVLKACVTCCPLLPLPAAVLAIAACVAALPAACPPLLLASLQQKIVERAKQMTEDDSADRLSQKAALQQEFEQLLNIFFTGRQHVPSVQSCTAPCSTSPALFCSGGRPACMLAMPDMLVLGGGSCSISAAWHYTALAAGLHAGHVEPFMVLGGGTGWGMPSIQDSACMLARVRSTGSMYHQRSMVLHRWQRACMLDPVCGPWGLGDGAGCGSWV